MREAVISIGDGDLTELGLDELVARCRDAGLREFEEFACYGNGAVVQVTVETELAADAIRALPYVDRLERLEIAAEPYRYLLAFTAPELSADIADHAAKLVGTCDPDLGEHGVTMSFVGPQEAIRGTVGEYEGAGLSPDLRHLGSYRPRDRPLDALTDRQREVIRTAYGMGYYEVPRAVSTADVAAELDLDPSTVAEHLQRAERNLLGHHLSAEG